MGDENKRETGAAVVTMDGAHRIVLATTVAGPDLVGIKEILPQSVSVQLVTASGIRRVIVCPAEPFLMQDLLQTALQLEQHRQRQQTTRIVAP